MQAVEAIMVFSPKPLFCNPSGTQLVHIKVCTGRKQQQQNKQKTKERKEKRRKNNRDRFPELKMKALALQGP